MNYTGIDFPGAKDTRRLNSIHSHGTMPHQEHLEIVGLHPNFAAEAKGIDFSRPISDEVFAEIKAAMTKVSILYLGNQPSSTSEILPIPPNEQSPLKC